MYFNTTVCWRDKFNILEKQTFVFKFPEKEKNVYIIANQANKRRKIKPWCLFLKILEFLKPFKKAIYSWKLLLIDKSFYFDIFFKDVQRGY